MAERVVQLLEAVQVNEENPERSPLRGLERPLDLRLKVRPVRQAGQGVVGRTVRQVIPRGLQVRIRLPQLDISQALDFRLAFEHLNLHLSAEDPGPAVDLLRVQRLFHLQVGLPRLICSLPLPLFGMECTHQLQHGPLLRPDPMLPRVGQSALEVVLRLSELAKTL